MTYYCEDHDDGKRVISCNCEEDHCPICTHAIEGRDKEFVELLKTLK